MDYTLPQISSATPRARLVKTFLALVATAGALHADNIDTYWTGASVDNPTDWFDPANWSNNVPVNGSPNHTGRAYFTSTGAGAPGGIVSNVILDGAANFNAFAIGSGTQKTLNLTLLDGASLTTTGLIQVGGAAGAQSHFNVIGPTTGSASLSYSSLQLGGPAAGNGFTATFSGAGLQVTDVSAQTVIGRQGSGHTLTIGDGATFTGKGFWISNVVNENGGSGNNHKLVVTGEGTTVTLSGLASANPVLAIGSRAVYTGSNTTGTTSTQIVSGNSVTVSDGGNLIVHGDNPNYTVTVQVGSRAYRQNNSINVTGANSVMEVKGNVTTTIGSSGSSNYNNRLVVSDGGLFLTDTTVTIDNTTSTAANRRNSLAIGAGGTFASSSVVNNNGGLVSLAETGALIGQTLAGAAAPLTLNINGTGRFEAAGSGLGDTVTVNIGSDPAKRAVLAVGLAGHASATTFTVNSTLNFNAGSLLEVSIFDDGIDSIFLGAGASVTIGANVGFSLVAAADLVIAPGSYQVFTGNTASIDGSFAVSDISLPELSEGLNWDLSQFNSAGNWTLVVTSPIPEPASAALLLGLGAVSVAALRRRRA